jgi:hypothetical protein
MSAQAWITILNLGGVLLLFTGVVLLAVALAGTRVGIGIRCRACGHEFPRGGTIPATCSDCGADLVPERALVLGRYKPRMRMLATGAMLVIAPSVGIAVFTGLVRSGAFAAPAVAATTDALIDAASTGDRMAKSELSNRLRGSAGSVDLNAWTAATERFTNDAEARATIIAAVCDAVMWADSFPNQAVAVDDATLRAFGNALTRALETDPEFAEAIPGAWGNARFAPAMAEPVLASPKAVRAFLRGPRLAIRSLELAGPSAESAPVQVGPMRDIEPTLVSVGFSNFGRSLAFGDASASYVRKDGSTVEIALRRGSTLPVLDPEMGTRIPIGAASDDPEWSGEIRLKATVGTVANIDAARWAAGSFPSVANPFDYEWSIRVERVEPKDIDAIAVCDPVVSNAIRRSLEAASLQVNGGDDAQTAWIELEPMGSDKMFIELEIEVVQDGRSWKEPRPPTFLQGQRPPFPAVGLDPTSPFELSVRGERPAITQTRVADHAYAAGTWTARFDRAARPPSSVTFTPVDGASTKAPPEATRDGRDKGRVIRD